MSCTKLFSSLKTKAFLQNSLLKGSLTQIRSCSNKCNEDVKTHTGQQFAPDDYRLARFVDRPKHVNKQFAIDLIAKIPPKTVKERVVWCDGGDEHTGHPRVYINLDKPGDHTCGYCGLRFIMDHEH